MSDVTEYLSSLTWDRVSRIDMLPGGAGWLIDAVRRAYEPGCSLKDPRALFLVGPEGSGKTSFLRELGGPWYGHCSYTLRKRGEQRYFEELSSFWIFEVGPIKHVFGKNPDEIVKHHLLITDDLFRKPFAHTFTRIPRSGVFVLTDTTDDMFSGVYTNRRVNTVRIDGSVQVNRDQVWAEAVIRTRT